jgi:hypothetical protein
VKSRIVLTPQHAKGYWQLREYSPFWTSPWRNQRHWTTSDTSKFWSSRTSIIYRKGSRNGLFLSYIFLLISIGFFSLVTSALCLWMAKLLGINLFCLISVDKRFLWLCIENILKKDIDVVILRQI